MVNYKQLISCVANREEYIHGSSRGFWVDGYYNIYSYTTLIARIKGFDDVAFWNGSYYSQTTSRLQNIIRDAYPIVDKVMS